MYHRHAADITALNKAPGVTRVMQGNAVGSSLIRLSNWFRWLTQRYTKPGAAEVLAVSKTGGPDLPGIGWVRSLVDRKDLKKVAVNLGGLVSCPYPRVCHVA